MQSLYNTLKDGLEISEKKDLLQDYLNIFGLESIKYLTADREFIGKDWFKWLKTNQIPFLKKYLKYSNVFNSDNLPFSYSVVV